MSAVSPLICVAKGSASTPLETFTVTVLRVMKVDLWWWKTAWVCFSRLCCSRTQRKLFVVTVVLVTGGIGLHLSTILLEQLKKQAMGREFTLHRCAYNPSFLNLLVNIRLVLGLQNHMSPLSFVYLGCCSLTIKVQKLDGKLTLCLDLLKELLLQHCLHFWGFSQFKMMSNCHY